MWSLVCQCLRTCLWLRGQFDRKLQEVVCFFFCFVLSIFHILNWCTNRDFVVPHPAAVRHPSPPSPPILNLPRTQRTGLISVEHLWTSLLRPQQERAHQLTTAAWPQYTSTALPLHSHKHKHTHVRGGIVCLWSQEPKCEPAVQGIIMKGEVKMGGKEEKKERSEKKSTGSEPSKWMTADFTADHRLSEVKEVLSFELDPPNQSFSRYKAVLCACAVGAD